MTLNDQVAKDLAFTPDGTILASAGYDGRIRLWDIAKGVELKILTGHATPVNSISFSSNGALLASGSDDGSAKI
ncbi:MAG: hypothetical protein HYY93_10270 [Planctomycetes bacterium]|nr:hypothetical protein [Planctomycetota bacterium]